MKISLNWVQYWAPIPPYTSESLHDFAHTYSTRTAEVEEVTSYIFDEKIVVGKIINWRPHPDSDKLGLVMVDTGEHGEHEIVCGAKNAQTAKYVPVALEHARLPHGLVIERRPIRGIDSCGMICSQDELGLQSERAEGIFPLETVWNEEILQQSLGKPFGSLALEVPGYKNDSIIYTMDDVIFDLDNKFITNRPDLFSVKGNAREIACIEWISIDHTCSQKNDFTSGESPQVTVQSDKVLNYTLSSYSLAEGVESPFLVRLLLMRSGQGSHGILPDLTNLVMTEIGQPMHVFDADTIKWSITLRMAKSGESLEALDGKIYGLSDKDLVIADEEKILALAGIIGGKTSGTSETTRNILVESATFDPITVRKTSQRLGLRTDSSIRFEKGVDRALSHIGQDRYRMFLDAYIKNTYRWAFIYSWKNNIESIALAHTTIEAKIGTSVAPDSVKTILTRLGFSVEENTDTYLITPPSWRATWDVSIPEDIIEEIARHIGYENISGSPLTGPLLTSHIHSHDKLTSSISHFFSHRGFHDVYTYPFTLEERHQRMTIHPPSIIKNASENRTHLRAHVGESLLELVAAHYRSYDHGGFFEFWPVFDHSESLQGVGMMWWREIHDMISALLDYTRVYFGVQGVLSQGTDTVLFAPRASGQILHPETHEILLEYGLIRPTLLPLYEIDTLDIYAFEIIKLPRGNHEHQFAPLQEYPGTHRELNIIAPEETPVSDIIHIIQWVNSWIHDFSVVEIYRDINHIGQDMKSVVIGFEITNPNWTITDEEAATIQTSIIAELQWREYKIRWLE